MKFQGIIVVAVVTALLLMLSSCAADSGPNLTGEWKGTVDISDHLAQIPGLEMPVQDITFDLIFVFGTDGRFEAIVDQYSVKLMIDHLLDYVADALKDTAAEQGIDEQELRKRVESAVNTDQLVDSVRNSLQNGYYLYRDGVIYLSAEDNLTGDPAKNAQEHLAVVVNGNKMIVEQIITDNYQHEQILGGVLPLTLYKQ